MTGYRTRREDVTVWPINLDARQAGRQAVEKYFAEVRPGYISILDGAGFTSRMLTCPDRTCQVSNGPRHSSIESGRCQTTSP